MKMPLTVAFFSWEYPPHIVGGLARHVAELSESLANEGVRVHVFTVGELNELEVMASGVIVHRVKPLVSKASFYDWVCSLNVAMMQAFQEIYETVHFDLLHAHDWLTEAVCSVLQKTYDVPLVTTIHSLELGRQGEISTELQRAIHEKEVSLIRNSEAVIVCSEFMKDEVNLHFETPRKPTVLPNGVRATEWPVPTSLSFMSDVGISTGANIVFSMGRMVPEKGFLTLIEAAELLKDEGIQFIIAGTGPCLQAYRDEVAKRKLHHCVHFIGQVDDYLRTLWMEVAFCCAFPSTYEPFGIVALESMVQGCPTIVSKTGGLKAIVQHKKSGWHVEGNEADVWATTIREVFRNQDATRHIAQEGQRIAQTLYQWNRIAKQTEMLYEEVLYERITAEETSSHIVSVQECAHKVGG